MRKVMIARIAPPTFIAFLRVDEVPCRCAPSPAVWSPDADAWCWYRFSGQPRYCPRAELRLVSPPRELPLPSPHLPGLSNPWWLQEAPLHWRAPPNREPRDGPLPLPERRPSRQNLRKPRSF